jgi:3-oxoacyl-[acyl-carrier-protein] synthase II
MRAAIAGLGQLSAAGAGIAALRRALTGARPEPAWHTCESRAAATRVPVYRASDAGAEGLVAPRAARRLDDLSRRALCAARLAMQDGALETTDPERFGILVVTGYGPLSSTFAFLDDVIDKGDALASPLLFSRSVHNAPTFTISSALGLRGPTLTVTGFGLPWARGLATAMGWLERDEVDLVLLGSADEFHPVVGCGLAELGALSSDGCLRPLDLLAPGTTPGETFTAMVLGRPETHHAKWGLVEPPQFFRGSCTGLELPAAAPLFLAASGDPEAGKTYLELARNLGRPVAAYGSLWGANPSADAMTIAAGAISLADQRFYETPHRDAVPAELELLGAGPTGSCAALCCATADATGRGALITIHRPGVAA